MNQGESHFLDSSAVVKLYVREPGSPRVLSLRESAPPGMVVVSGITPVEVTSALVRRCGQGHFGVTELNTALDLLTRCRNEFTAALGGILLSLAVTAWLPQFFFEWLRLAAMLNPFTDFFLLAKAEDAGTLIYIVPIQVAVWMGLPLAIMWWRTGRPAHE